MENKKAKILNNFHFVLSWCNKNLYENVKNETGFVQPVV